MWGTHPAACRYQARAPPCAHTIIHASVEGASEQSCALSLSLCKPLREQQTFSTAITPSPSAQLHPSATWCYHSTPHDTDIHMPSHTYHSRDTATRNQQPSNATNVPGNPCWLTSRCAAAPSAAPKPPHPPFMHVCARECPLRCYCLPNRKHPSPHARVPCTITATHHNPQQQHIVCWQHTQCQRHRHNFTPVEKVCWQKTSA
jgi:hypothetical protein